MLLLAESSVCVIYKGPVLRAVHLLETLRPKINRVGFRFMEPS